MFLHYISQSIGMHYKCFSKGWFWDERDVFWCGTPFTKLPLRSNKFPGTLIFIRSCYNLLASNSEGIPSNKIHLSCKDQFLTTGCLVILWTCVVGLFLVSRQKYITIWTWDSSEYFPVHLAVCVFTMKNQRSSSYWYKISFTC